MKRKITYEVNGITYRRRVRYIPVRFSFAVILGLISTLLVIAIVIAMALFVPYFYIPLIVAHVAVVIQIIASENNPDFKVPWLVLILGLPVVGFMLYYMFARRKLKRKLVNRLNALRGITYKHNDKECFEQLKKENAVACTQAESICKIADTHAFAGRILDDYSGNFKGKGK